MKLNCKVCFDDDQGANGYIYFDYNGRTLCAWNHASNPIIVFYPHWCRLKLSELTDNVTTEIQKHNLSTHNTIYWLKEKNSFTLSSTVNLYLTGYFPHDFQGVQEVLTELVSTDIFFTKEKRSYIMTESTISSKADIV